MDLGDFQLWIDLRFHRDEVTVTANLVEKRAQVWKRHGAPGLRLAALGFHGVRS
jgi:hypothetical protein